MNINKKIILSIFIILAVLSTLAMYKPSYAIATPEMDATGISLRDNNVGDTVYYTLNDLYTRYDILCSQHGTHAFIDGEEILEISGMTFDLMDAGEEESEYEAENEEIKVNNGGTLHRITFYNNNIPANIVIGEEAETISINGYKIKERRTATPKEAYILAEMKENTMYNERVSSLFEYKTNEDGERIVAHVTERDFSKVFDANSADGVLLTIYSIEEKDDDGRIINQKYYVKENEIFYEVDLKNVTPSEDYGILSYVQNAWWTTAAGSLGYGVIPNELANEAENFQGYIKEVSKVNDISELEYDVKEYTFIDASGEEHSGEVMAPEFEYNPIWNEDANNDKVINENDNAVVAWDGDTQTYKVGPFSIDYVKGGSQTGDRGTVFFAGITEAKIITNVGELSRVSDPNVSLESGQYRFIYRAYDEEGNEVTRDDSEFPNPNETFYLEIAYAEGMTEISNVNFNFKYMNAGGEYQYLEGTGTKQNWKVFKYDEYNNNECTVEDCERSHYSYEGRSYHDYYVKNNIEIRCISIEHNKDLQTFAYGVNGARWYEETSLESNDGWEIEKEGSIILEKVVVDENGIRTPVSKDTDFYFMVNVRTYFEDGTDVTTAEKVKVTVKKDQSSGKSRIITARWKDGVESPDYILREEQTSNEYEFVNIESLNGAVTAGELIEGKFVENDTISVIATNKIKSKSGNLTIRKVPIGLNLLSKTFYFNIYIDGNLYIEKAPVSATTNWKYTMPEYTWTGEAPRYRVVEVNENGEQISIDDGILNFATWKSGYLEEGTTEVKVYEWNMPIPNKGILEVRKILKDADGNEIAGVPFNFNVYVEGYGEIPISIASGGRWYQTFYWYGDEAPSYTVTEEDNEDYEFVSIETSNGTVEGKTATGSLLDNDTVSVVANNKDLTILKKIQITKQIVTEEGELVLADEDTVFKFNLVITKADGTIQQEPVEVIVREGESTAISQPIEVDWKRGEVAPTYKVTETMINDEYVLLEMENGEGTLEQENTVINVIAKNKKIGEDEEKGSIQITKKILNESGIQVEADEEATFKFNVEVTKADGTKESQDIELKVDAGKKEVTSDVFTYVWKEGEVAPTYKVTEYDNADYEFYSINATNGTVNGKTVTGSLIKDNTIYVTAENKQRGEEDETGSIQITKKILDESGIQVGAYKEATFTFRVEVTKADGTKESQDINLEVIAGQSIVTSNPIVVTWKRGEAAPTYKVTECDNADYEFYDIYSTNGTKTGKTVTGSLIKDDTIYVTAENKKIDEDKETGSIQITKKILDEFGIQVGAYKQSTFTFRVEVTKADGTKESQDINLDVIAGQKIVTSNPIIVTWKKGEATPTYKVTEYDNADYEFHSINATNGTVNGKTVTGSLIKDNTIYVTAENKQRGEEDETGSIQITKKILDESGIQVGAYKEATFTFRVEVTKADGTKESQDINLEVIDGQSIVTSNPIVVTWKRGEATPTYKITEYDNADYEFYSINSTNGTVNGKTVTGSLIKDDTIYVTAENKQAGTITQTIEITKQIVNKNGELVEADEDTVFYFNLVITKADGTTQQEPVEVIVRAGQSTATSQPIEITWKSGEVAPTYKVTETMINGKYELLDMENEEGILSEDTIISVIATNKVKELSGTLKIVKRIDNIDDEEIKNKEFEVKINKNGEFYKTVYVSVNNPYIEEFIWDANEPTPVITIEEINLPENTQLVGYINNGASLLDAQGKETIIIAENKIEIQKGKIQINKELIDSAGNSIDGIPFEFRLSVDGYEDKIITIKSGETWRSDYFYWTSEDGPTYTVTELDNENYEFVSVSSSDGTVSGKSVTGKLVNNVILAPISYINKTKVENEGSIKVTKQLEAEDKVDVSTVTDKFEFAVTIYYEDSDKYFEYNGENYNSLTINRTVNGQGTTDPINIKWYEDAPKYNVKEINLPNDWRFKEFTNPNYGTLQNETEVEVICLNEQIIDRKYYFTMEMGGKVWNDTNYENGKPADVEPDGIIGESEEGLSNIKVVVYKVIKTADGNIVDKYVAGEITDSYENILSEAILYTDENGIWKINKISVPALTEADKAKGYTKENGYLAAYDVEFTYDGQTYEPTKFLEYSDGDASRYLNAILTERDNYLNDSMAIDNATERDRFNKRFQTIYGEQAIDDNGNTIGQAISGNDANIEELYYSSTDRQASTDSSTRKVSTLDLYNESGDLYEVFEMQARTSNGGLVYPFDSKTVLKNADTEIEFGVRTISYYYHAAYPYLNSINLGLVERRNADIALEKDLQQAIVVVNEKALKYNYGEIANTQFDTYPDLLYKQIQVSDKEIEYKLDLYRSDYYYRASIYNGTEAGDALENFYKNLGFTGKEEVELDVYLKYKITVTNESDSYDIEVKEISDYYDSDMTLVSADVSKYLENNNGTQVNEVTTIAEASYKYNPDGTRTNISWTNNGSITDSNSGKSYNRITTTGLFGDKISSGDSRSIYVTFKVNKAIDSTTGIDNCIKLGNKYNIAEIDAYSTYYEDGRVAGKVDEDSAPGNINIADHNDSTWYEDDANSSPVLIIGLYDVIRQMDGLVWEDSESETIQYDQNVGNGEYESNENTIPNMTTELYEKVTVDGIDYDFLWPTDSRTITGLDGYTIQELTGLDSTINTDGEGKYNFTGIAAGNYVVRFTYGDSNTINYNGQDYKSTTYQAGFDNDSNDDGIIDNIWHDLTNNELAEKRVSDSRDNEARRLEVIEKSQTLTYENTSVMAGEKPGLEDYYMTADTAKINMNIEKNTTGTESIGGITVNTQKGIIDTTIGAVGATDITYDINNIDFGLERRSETNIVLDKQIEEIKLITSAGDVILDAVYDISYTGDVANVVLNSEKSIGEENLQALNNSLGTGIQGFRYINIDENILQGATIEIRYRFTVLNTSEVDRCAVKLKEITDFSVAIADAATQNASGIFGTYLGKVYYSGKGAMNASGESDDAIVETTVHKLVDYVDNDVVFSATNNIIKDGSWTNTTTEQLKDMKLIDENIINSDEGKILDDEYRAYESENKNNLIVSVENNDDTQEQLTNPGFVKALKPLKAIDGGVTGDYAASISLTVSRYYSSESDSETIDNLAEIIQMYNDVGRRDVDTVQGNANPAEGVFVTALKENDASATEVITLTPPTGLSSKVIFTIQVLSVVLSAIAILTVGIIALKKKVLTK